VLGTHAAQANPTSRNTAVSVQLCRFGTFGERDRRTYIWQTLSDTEDDMLLANDQARSTDEAI
jgi:2'-5' RNA ligase